MVRALGFCQFFLNKETMYGQTAFDGSMVVSKTCNLLLDVRVIWLSIVMKSIFVDVDRFT